MHAFINTHRNIFLIAGALFIAFLLRFPQINGDPPAGDISRSGVFLADEGSYGYNALQWALIGQWYTPDASNPVVNTPIFTVYEYALMKFFTISLATVRYGGVICGIFVIIMIYFILSKFDQTAAGIAVFLCAVNFPMIIYNRLALLENLLLCFMLFAALILLAILRNPTNIKLVIAFWLIFMLGCLTKPLIIFFVLLYIVMAWQIDLKTRKRIFLFSAFTIVLLSSILWFFWISKYPDEWLHFQGSLSMRISLNPLNIMQNYTRFLSHIKLYEFMPVMYVIALLMAVRGIINVFQKKEMAMIERFLLLWFLFGVIFLGFFAYSPPRYSLILLPAIFGLNGLFFSEIFHKDQRNSAQNWPRLSLLGIAVICLLQIAFGLYRVFVYQHIYPSCFLPIAGLLALTGLWIATHYKISATLIGRGLLSMIFILQGIQVFRYHNNMEFSLYSAMQDVSRILKQDERNEAIALAGDSAPLFGFEVHVPTINTMYRQDKLPALVKRMTPGFLFLEDPNELSNLKKLLPDYFQSVTELKQYRLMNNYKHGRNAILYRID